MIWRELDEALAALGPGAQVIEVGTGAGSLFGHLLERLRVGGRWSLVTLDLDDQAVQEARGQIRALPAPARARCAVECGDVLDYAVTRAGCYDLAVASALLSSVPLTRPGEVADVLDSLPRLLKPGGRLMLEDYLPLPGPDVSLAGAAAATRNLWRWYKAVAELSGLHHYQELPPQWVARRLVNAGLADVRIAIDDRQEVRAPDEFAQLAGQAVACPPGLGPELWFALDRYRRKCIEAIAVGGGLVQWSGWYRITARR